MALRVQYAEKALAELEKLPKNVRRQIAKKIDAIAQTDNAPKVKRLHGELRDYLRVRSGDYRAWYFIDDGCLYVVRVMNRKDGYD